MRRADRVTLLMGLFWLSLIACVALLASCEPPPSALPDNLQCSPGRLAELEGLYFAEVLVLCKGYELETCPAVPELERKHQARVEEWVKCR